MRWRTAARRSGLARDRVVVMGWPRARLCLPSLCPRRRPWRSWRLCPPHTMLPTRIWPQLASGRSWTSSIPGPGRKRTSWPTASGSMHFLPPRAPSGQQSRRRWSSSGCFVSVTRHETAPRLLVMSSLCCSLPRVAGGIWSDGAVCATRCDGSPRHESSVPASPRSPVAVTPSTRSGSPRRTPDRCTAGASDCGQSQRRRLGSPEEYSSHRRDEPENRNRPPEPRPSGR